MAFKDLTQDDGSLVKVPSGPNNNGIQKFPTTRSLLTAKLRHASGTWLVYIATVGGPRKDGRTNAHRMYRLLPNGLPPYFQYFKGPWEYTFDSSCAVAGDINNDGLDDLFVCEKRGPGRFYLQQKSGTFREVILPSKPKLHWRNVRLANITKQVGSVDCSSLGALCQYLTFNLQ